MGFYFVLSKGTHPRVVLFLDGWVLIKVHLPSLCELLPRCVSCYVMITLHNNIQSQSHFSSSSLNTRRVSRGRGTDAETTTMPTFLMVGKVTQRTIQFDQEPQGVSARISVC